MKRFFPVLLAVLLVVFSAVPALAADSDFGPFDHLVTSDKPYATVTTNSVDYMLFVSELEWVFTGTYYSLDACNWTKYDWNGNEWVYDKTGTNKNQTTDFDPLSANYNVKDDNGDIVLSFVECDGSTCPAVDVNFDNICDDCGNTFSVMRSYSWPALPSLYDGYNYFIAKNADGAYYLYFLDGTGDVVYDTSTGQLTPNVTLHFYYADVGATEWRSMGSHASGSSFDFSDRTFQVSTVDILNEVGDPFFPPVPPLWNQIQGVTEQEMPSLTQTMGGTMKILVLCGVGLMASLAVLSLFGKRSLISRR